MRHKYVTNYKNVCLRPLEERDIELLRLWRNNPNNTRYLSKLPYITEQMQQEWFKQYLDNEDEICFAVDEVVELKRFVGALSLHAFSGDSCLLGHVLIGDEEAHGKKVGLNASIAATQIAFNKLKIKTVNLHVYSENIAAYKVYQQAGFKIIDTHFGNNGEKEYTMSLTEVKDDAQYE